MTALQGPAAIRHFFHHNHIPPYVSTSTFNLLGAGHRSTTLHLLIPPTALMGGTRTSLSRMTRWPTACRIAAANNYLLHQAVADYVHQRGPNGAVLFLMFDASTERLARHLGLRVCFPLPHYAALWIAR